MARKKAEKLPVRKVSIRLAMSEPLAEAVRMAAAREAGGNVTEWICRMLAELVGLADWQAPDRRGRPKGS